MEFLEKNKRKIALVVIDVQKKFRLERLDETLFKKHIDIINEATRLFRDAQRPVIFVNYIGNSECHPYDGEDGDEYFDEIITAETDIIVYKKHMNSFRESELAQVVKATGCDNVLLAGTVTQYCVLATYFSAFDHGLVPYLLQGGCLSNDEAVNQAAELICKTYDLAEVKENLLQVRV